MAITFPSSPNSGDTFTSGGRSWQYNGTAWIAYGNLPDPSVFAVDATNDIVTVTGNLTVSGTTTTINTTELNVQDNVITLNYGVTGTPSLDAGIEVERGDLANTSITWDESAESWVVGGTAYVDTANSRVGIGTASPAEVLEISDSTRAFVIIDDTGGTVGADTFSKVEYRAGGTYAGHVGFNNTSVGILGLVNNNGEVRLQTNTADQILLRTNNSTRVTVTGTGEVGIGTTSPTGTVDLNGNNSTLVFTSPSNTNRYRIDANISDAADYGLSIGYWDGSAYQRTLTVDDSGNVGIGTTAPGALLHVSAGTSGDAEIRIQADSDNNDENDNPILTFMQDGSYFSGVIGMTNNVLNIVNSTNSNQGIKMGVVAANNTSGQSVITSMTTPALEITPANNVKMNGDLTVFGSIYHDVSGASSSDPVIWIDAENIDVPLIRVGTDQWSTSSDHGFTIQYNGAGSGDLNTLSILADNQTGTQVNALTITQSGKIGMGAGNPQAAVHVSSSTSPLMYLRMSNNASGARIQFSDQSSEAQKGYMTYYHADGSSYGHGNAFVFDSTESTMTVVSTDDFTAVGTLTQNYSDERLKTIHGTIPDALSKLSGVRGYLYTQNETADSLGFKEVGVQQVGVSAQEVMSVMPEVVAVAPISYTDKTEEEYYTVRYERMVPLLIEAIHELTARIEALEAG